MPETLVAPVPLPIAKPGPIHWNLGTAALYEEAVRRDEGTVAESGPLVCITAPHTGRSPNDKFLVKEPSTERDVWWGKVNRPIDGAVFDALYEETMASLDGRTLYVQDCFAGADPDYRLPIRIVTERAWHSLFARTMFLEQPAGTPPGGHEPQFTVIDIPSMTADPARHGTNSGTFILLNFARRTVLIGGTSYAGEIKKSIFTVMNYLLPARGIMSMHCSANIGADGDTALFFGLSGTGKTTLSSDPHRGLIGDDEHGWSDNGIFNFEGGCYAKTIKLSEEAEPEIYSTTRRFGTVLENVVMDPATRRLDLDDDSITENTRGAYPISFIDNWVPSGRGGHPANIVMLTCDAFGVLPPISRLTPAGAMYHFLSGYTAKVAGTEKGITEPKATFSTCFGAPFMVHHPTTYAKLLGDRIASSGARVWLVNTGWTGGAYGVGSRMKIAHTRAMISAALSGALDDVPYAPDPIFNVDVPTAVPDVPREGLQPRAAWSDGAAYDAQAVTLAGMFAENFAAFESEASDDVRQAGPRA
ncbi:MAG: phosphoenolpyruvate carboxykinase (ATP) [Acidobacteria bacterium]|nr:phosphoenolpyruvate carboxykinase (ATP) [Acidobacteriota bacterium]MYD71529.1 phosphoenolpyruvate carboxykinase (ATP) [Acidobacteriota bacterium]